jgi:hypothetical protein
MNFIIPKRFIYQRSSKYIIADFPPIHNKECIKENCECIAYQTLLRYVKEGDTIKFNYTISRIKNYNILHENDEELFTSSAKHSQILKLLLHPKYNIDVHIGNDYITRYICQYGLNDSLIVLLNPYDTLLDNPLNFEFFSLDDLGNKGEELPIKLLMRNGNIDAIKIIIKSIVLNNKIPKPKRDEQLRCLFNIIKYYYCTNANTRNLIHYHGLLSFKYDINKMASNLIFLCVKTIMQNKNKMTPDNLEKINKSRLGVDHIDDLFKFLSS